MYAFTHFIRVDLESVGGSSHFTRQANKRANKHVTVVSLLVTLSFYVATCLSTGNYRAFGSASFLDDKKRVVLPKGKHGDPNCKYEVKAGKGSDDKTCSDGEWELLRHVSFVDCPGHDILMATMLNGAAVMDAALLLIAGNETCPQPQTAEHLAAVEIMKLQNIIILQVMIAPKPSTLDPKG